MKLLSNIRLNAFEKEQIYIYKMGCVKQPENYTFVGEVHTASTGGIGGPKIVVYDKEKNVSKLLSNTFLSTNRKHYSYFGIMRAGDDVSIYSLKFGLYYSTSQTNNESDLRDFTAIQWSPDEEKRYWIYKRNTIKEPEGYQLIMKVFTASTKGSGGAKVMVMGKTKSEFKTAADSYRTKKIELKFPTDIKNVIWTLKPINKKYYYHTTETTDASELNKFTKTLKGRSISSKYCIYQKK